MIRAIKLNEATANATADTSLAMRKINSLVSAASTAGFNKVQWRWPVVSVDSFLSVGCNWSETNMRFCNKHAHMSLS